MKRRLGAFGAAVIVMCSLALVASGPAGATGPRGRCSCRASPLGDAAHYGEYAAGTSSVIGETVGGAAAYGGSATITNSNFGVSPLSFFSPGLVTLALGGPTSSVTGTALVHGRAHYVGSFSGSSNFGTFAH